MQKVIFILFLLIFSTTQAQFKISTIKDASPFERESLEFPFIRSANTNVANKINAFLQSEMLENPTVITNPRKIFFNRKYIRTDSINQSGYSDMSYKVIMNTARVLSLQFDVETTGAYSHYYNEYHSFNAQTGKPILAAAIFTAEGIKYLRKYLVKERAKLINRFIEEECQDYQDTAYIKERYAACNQEATESQIFVLPNNIMFYKDDCFPHAARPYNTDLNITIPIVQLQKYLTDYGRKLLL